MIKCCGETVFVQKYILYASLLTAAAEEPDCVCVIAPGGRLLAITHRKEMFLSTAVINWSVES